MLKNWGPAVLATGMALALLAGCSDGDERRHPLFVQGKKAREAGNGLEAAAKFNELLKRRPEAQQLHLELAGVYDELLNDPLMAVVHYRLYLENVPGAPDADAIRTWQQQAEKRFYEEAKSKYESLPQPEPASGAPGAPGAPGVPDVSPMPDGAASPGIPAEDPAVALARTRERLEQYKNRLALLSAEVRRLRQVAGTHRNPPPPDRPADRLEASPGTAGSYTVAAGDTPAKIARKVYGDSRLYPAIMRANPQVSERSLRPGMILNIPPQKP